MPPDTARDADPQCEELGTVSLYCDFYCGS